jgi:hypothetical protein
LSGGPDSPFEKTISNRSGRGSHAAMVGAVRLAVRLALANQRRPDALDQRSNICVYSLNQLAHAAIDGRRGGGWPTAGCGRRAARARNSIILTAQLRQLQQNGRDSIVRNVGVDMVACVDRARLRHRRLAGDRYLAQQLLGQLLQHFVMLGRQVRGALAKTRRNRTK